MPDYCEFSTFCPIFAVLQDPSHKLTRDAYCHGDFGECKRRQLMMAGEDAPENMLPSGVNLIDQNKRTHTVL